MCFCFMINFDCFLVTIFSSLEMCISLIDVEFANSRMARVIILRLNSFRQLVMKFIALRGHWHIDSLS